MTERQKYYCSFYSITISEMLKLYISLGVKRPCGDVRVGFRPYSPTLRSKKIGRIFKQSRLWGSDTWKTGDSTTVFPPKITEIIKMQKYKCSENNLEWFILQRRHFSFIPPHHCMFVSPLMWRTFSVVMLLEISEYYFICVPVSLTFSWWWWWWWWCCNQPPELSGALHHRLLTSSIHHHTARSLALSRTELTW